MPFDAFRGAMPPPPPPQPPPVALEPRAYGGGMPASAHSPQWAADAHTPATHAPETAPPLPPLPPLSPERPAAAPCRAAGAATAEAEAPPPPLSPFVKSETLHGLEASQRLLEEKLEHLKQRLAEEGATV